jgi:hypothetical protein
VIGNGERRNQRKQHVEDISIIVGARTQYDDDNELRRADDEQKDLKAV